MSSVREPETASDGIVIGPQSECSVAGRHIVSGFSLLWDERRFLIKVTILALIASIVIALLLPAKYQSTTQLMPPNAQSNDVAMLGTMLAKMGDSASLATAPLELKTTGALLVRVLQSRTVADQLINRFDLRTVYQQKELQDARKTLASNSEISEDRKTGVITITVEDQKPERAAQLAQGYSDELNRLVGQLTTSGAHRERVFLEERLKIVNQQLQADERALGQFASKNATIDVKIQGKALVESAAALQGQMSTAQAELQGLRQVYGTDNVRVHSAQARVAELGAQLRKLSGKANTTDTDIESPYPSIRKLPLLDADYADLYRRVRVQESIFDRLTQAYELAKVQEAKEIPNVKVLDPAEIPHRRSSPVRSLLVMWGVLTGFIVAVAWVLSRAAWEQLDPQDPAKLLAKRIEVSLQSANLTSRAAREIHSQDV